MATTFLDLVMDNGELVRIECSDKFDDELYSSLEMAMKRKDWWSPSQFDRCHAEYMGILLDRVNMARVVGMRR